MAVWEEQWNSEPWRRTAEGWVDRVLEAYQTHRVGPMTPVKIKLAAATFLVSSEAGDLYFKASAPPRAYEAALTATIAPISGGHVPTPLAIESRQGWLLTPALGITATAAGRQGPDTWARILGQAAELQVALSDDVESLEAAGAPALLPANLADYLDEALMVHSSSDPAHPLSLDPAVADQMTGSWGLVEEATQMLADSSLPLTLQQGRTNLDEVLLPDTRRAPWMFLGWGEAAISHPFAYVAPVVARLCDEYGAEPHQDPIRPILEAYAAPFGSAASVEDVIELLGPALLLSHAQHHRALMDLLYEASPEDQHAGAPEVFETLRAATAAPSARGRRAAPTRSASGRGRRSR